MRAASSSVLGLFLCFSTTLSCFGQAASGDAPGLPTGPREIFSAAAPLYGFNDAALRPYRLKATYQLFDEDGKAAEAGTFEYWWASPAVNRSTWTRAGATHTDWHTADGKYAHIAKGDALGYFEYRLKGALLSPLPDAADLDPAKASLEPESVTGGSVKLPCVMVVPQLAQHGKAETVTMGLFPTYCFDPKVPVLRIMYSFGSVTEEFNRIAKVQGRDIPREIQLFDGKRKILSATLDSVDGILPSDAALTPTSDAKVSGAGTVQMAADVVSDALLKRQPPFYPPDAKQVHQDGRVVLQATIGVDGGVRDLHVVSAPMPSMAASALWAVTHWQYNPFVVKGEPVEVETTINVQFNYRD